MAKVVPDTRRVMSQEEVKYPYPGAADAEAYEWLNRCSDPERKVEALIAGLAPWKGKTFLDVGAGSGYHSVWFAEKAAHVIAVEPDPRLRRQMFSRLAQASAGRISVVSGSAEDLPLRDASIDIAYARFAYFFGTPDCLPGLAEVTRVLKSDGHLFVIDVIPEYGECGRMARREYPRTFHAKYHENQVDFYRAHGFDVHRVETVFRAPNREVLAKVFRMDFPRAWEELVRGVRSLELTYGIAVFHRAMAKKIPGAGGGGH